VCVCMDRIHLSSAAGNTYSRVQLAPPARRRAVPTTESERVPAKSCANDEVTKSGRTGITTAYTEKMLCRERTHGLHNALLTRR